MVQEPRRRRVAARYDFAVRFQHLLHAVPKPLRSYPDAQLPFRRRHPRHPGPAGGATAAPSTRSAPSPASGPATARQGELVPLLTRGVIRFTHAHAAGIALYVSTTDRRARHRRGRRGLPRVSARSEPDRGRRRRAVAPRATQAKEDSPMNADRNPDDRSSDDAHTPDDRMTDADHLDLGFFHAHPGGRSAPARRSPGEAAIADLAPPPAGHRWAVITLLVAPDALVRISVSEPAGGARGAPRRAAPAGRRRDVPRGRRARSLQDGGPAGASGAGAAGGAAARSTRSRCAGWSSWRRPHRPG